MLTALVILAMEAGQYDDATAYARDAERLAPDYFDAKLYLETCFLKKGDRGSALQLFDQAYTLLEKRTDKAETDWLHWALSFLKRQLLKSHQLPEADGERGPF